MRDIDRQLQVDDPHYDSELSRLLLPYLDRDAPLPRLIRDTADPSNESLPPLIKWDPSKMSLPVGTCLLSSSYRWPFDVRDSP